MLYKMFFPAFSTVSQFITFSKFVRLCTFGWICNDYSKLSIWLNNCLGGCDWSSSQYLCHHFSCAIEEQESLHHTSLFPCDHRHLIHLYSFILSNSTLYYSSLRKESTTSHISISISSWGHFLYCSTFLTLSIALERYLAISKQFLLFRLPHLVPGLIVSSLFISTILSHPSWL